MAHKDLLDWVAKQAEWTQDALRRHALAPNFELNANGKTELVKRVRRAAGLGDEDCAHDPVTADHLQGAGAAGPRTLLVSLGSVKNSCATGGEPDVELCHRWHHTHLWR